MNKIIKDYKENYIRENLTRDYLPKKENDELNEKYYRSEEIDEKYKFERDSDPGSNKLHFYIEETAEITDTELNQYINMKTLDRLTETDSKIEIIKKAIVFWLILTIIGIIVSLYYIIKLASIFG